MNDKETRLRLRYIDESMARVERNQNRFMDEDRGMERRVQKLEDYNVAEIKAQMIQVKMELARIKQRDATSAWFWGKIAGVAAAVAGAVFWIIENLFFGGIE